MARAARPCSSSAATARRAWSSARSMPPARRPAPSTRAFRSPPDALAQAPRHLAVRDAGVVEDLAADREAVRLVERDRVGLRVEPRDRVAALARERDEMLEQRAADAALAPRLDDGEAPDVTVGKQAPAADRDALRV